MSDIWSYLKRATATTIPLWAGLLILLGIGLVAYLPSFSVPFHFDGYIRILDNHRLRSLDETFRAFSFGFPRYLVDLTFAFNYALAEYSVFGWHVVNFFAHAIASILVWWFIAQTLKLYEVKTKLTYPSRWLGFLVAAIFLLHPIQTGSVTYITQRFTIFSAMFSILAMSLLARFLWLRRKNTLRKVTVLGYVVAIGVAMLAAWHSKENSYILPILMVVYYGYFGEVGRLSTKQIRWLLFGGVLAIAVVALVGTQIYNISYVFGTKISVLREEITPYRYFLSQFEVYLRYWKLLLVPLGQNLDHFVPLATSFFSPRAFMSMLAVGSVVLVMLLWRKTYRLFSFGLAWFFVTMLVESSIFPLEDLMFEHRLYLPSVGIFLIMVMALYYLLSAELARTVATVIIICLLYTGLTYHRNTIWQTELALWTDVTTKAPQKQRGFNNVGIYYIQAGQHDKALPFIQQALRIDPLYVESWNNLGLIYKRFGQLDRAKEALQQAIRISPTYSRALNNLGNIAMIEEDYETAVMYFNAAIEANPMSAAPRENLLRLEQLRQQ